MTEGRTMRHAPKSQHRIVALALGSLACATSAAAQPAPATLAPAATATVDAPRPTVAKPKITVGKVKPQTKETTWLAWASEQVFGPPDPVASSKAKPPIAKIATPKINIAVRPKPEQQPAFVTVAVPVATPQATLDAQTAERQPLATGSIDTTANASTLSSSGGLTGRTLALLAMLREGRNVARPVYRTIDTASAARDIIPLELANRAYDENQTPGHHVFQTRDDWRVLEHAVAAMDTGLRQRAETSGFDATAYVNHAERRIIVAIAGSCARLFFGARQAAVKSQQDCKKDWIDNDINAALRDGRSPDQFSVARDYITTVVNRHVATDGGTHYRVECSGHSLGGGACAFAAAALDLRATTLNPISAGVLAAKRPELITNYVVEGDLARVVYGLRGLSPTGVVIVIDDGRDRIKPIVKAINYGPLRGTAYFVGRKVIEAFLDHKLGVGLDRLAEQGKISRVR
jgi:hypothetical protein